jgi:hypothetical protein
MDGEWWIAITAMSNERRATSDEGRMGKSSWLMAEREVGNGL